MTPLVLLAALALPGTGHAESLLTLRDPLYATRAVPPQLTEVVPRVRQIAYPVLGMPALVKPGDTFSVLVAPGCPIQLGGLEASLALVGSSPEITLPLEVREVRKNDPVKDVFRITVEAPVDIGADHYDLRIEDGKCVRDTQPSSVRIYRDDQAFRFAILSDEQLGDPRGRLENREPNGSLFPSRRLPDPQVRFIAQVQSELEFLDPLFVLYPGDAVFGMDYRKEYVSTADRLGDARLATFMVPGNHDAYAAHVLQAREGWRRSMARLALCGKSLLGFDPLQAVLDTGACTVSTMSDIVDYKLDYDGIQGWRHTLGPDFYAFEVGNFRFLGVNTYEGSVARRQSLPLSLGRIGSWLDPELDWPTGIDPSLGAPLVDNFGGYLSPASLEWMEGQVKDARKADTQVVLFGHHDPTGLFMGNPAFAANTPFGTDPVAATGFEVWNFEGAWDSDPTDPTGNEQVDKNSATTLLARLVEGPAWFFGGHTHRDDVRLLKPGESVGAVRAPVRGEVQVIQTTTGAVQPGDPNAYKGYRLVTVEKGAITRTEFAPDRGWAAVPAGNLWVENQASDGDVPHQAVVSGLPVPVTGRLRFALPANEVGYRFRTTTGQVLPLSDLYQTTRTLVGWVQVDVPAASTVATTPEALVRQVVAWEEATGNDRPAARLCKVGEKERKKSKPLKVKAGRQISLTAAESADQDGFLRVTTAWGGVVQEGLETTWEAPGQKATDVIKLTVWDPWGAMGTATREIQVKCGLFGGACRGGGGSGKSMKVRVD